jgi:solute carrier family 25 (mitochondrial carnitine/acylcarnitine transporter), member 20/29
MKGSVDCAQKIYKQYGVRGVFKGFVPTFLREAIGTAFYFGTFEFVSRKFYSENQKPSDCPTYAILLAGALAGNVFWIATYPLDVVKSKI